MAFGGTGYIRYMASGKAILCALAFGALSVMRFYFPTSFIPISIYEIFPYLATVIVLVTVSLRKRRANQPRQAWVWHISERKDKGQNKFNVVIFKPIW